MAEAPEQRWQDSRVVLVDPALRDDTGHHEQLALGYARAIGLERCWFAAHRGCPPLPGAAPERVIGAFATSYYELGARARLGGPGLALLQAWRGGRVVADPALRRRLETSAPVRVLVAAGRGLGRLAQRGGGARPAPLAPAPPPYLDELLALIDRLRLGPADHLALVSVEGQTALAVLWLLAVRDPATLPALHLRFMFDDRGFRTAAADYANLVDRLAATGLVGRRLFLYAETATLAARMAEAAGAAVDLAPYPPLEAAPAEAALRPDGAAVTLGFLGEARREKGFHRLAGLLEAFAREHPAEAARSRAVIHAGGASAEALDLAAGFAAWARRAPIPVELTTGVVPTGTYAGLLARIDVLLCPMDAEVYAARGSGVAQEAAAAGKVVLHPAGLSLDELDPASGGAGAGPALSPADLAAAVADYPARAAAARAAAAGVRARFASGRLIERCRAPAPAPGALPPRTLLIGDQPGPAGPRLRVRAVGSGEDPAAAIAPLYAGPLAPGEGFLSLACARPALPALLRRLAAGGMAEG